MQRQIVYRVTPGGDLDWNLDPPSLSFSSKNRLEFHCDVVFWKNLDATDRTPEGVFVRRTELLPRSNLLGPRVTVIRVGEYVEKDICWNVSNNG
jgi:hypothetical protein